MIDAVGLALAGMEDPAVDPLFFNEKIWHAVAVRLREENIRLRESLKEYGQHGDRCSSNDFDRKSHSFKPCNCGLAELLA